MKKYTWHKGDKGNKFWRWIAWRIPHKLIYWASVRLIANATMGKYSSSIVPELAAMDALKIWDLKDGGDRTFKDKR